MAWLIKTLFHLFIICIHLVSCELSVVTESPQTYFWFLNTALKTSEFWYYLAMNIHRRSYTEAKGDRTFYKLHDLSQCCLNCTNFGKLSLRKIIKIAATRCHILKLKCTKFDFSNKVKQQWKIFHSCYEPFLSDSDIERILKIAQHLPKLQ